MRIVAKLIASLVLFSQLALSGQPASVRTNRDLMVDLVNAPLAIVYHDDGAADGTVTAMATADPSRQDAPAEVRAIIDRGKNCVPLLIAHLGDRRLTAARFDGLPFSGMPIQVPLGYVCLDILLHVTSGPTVHVADCADDGLGACIRSGYYYRPDVLWERNGTARMRKVQARWQRAYQSKQIRFEYPRWLKRG